MKNEKFGSIVIDGKMIDLDRSKIEDLEKIEKDLEIQEKSLKQKITTVFKQ